MSDVGIEEKKGFLRPFFPQCREKGWLKLLKNKKGEILIKIRSLKEQMRYAVNNSVKIGHSKRDENKNKDLDNKDRLYSIERTEQMRDFCNNFCKWMKEEHPEVRLVRDIKPEHAQEYLNQNAQKWTDRTAQEYASKFRKLDKILQNTYHTKDFTKGLEVPKGQRETTRNIAMSREDLQMVRQSYAERDSKSAGRDALEITARCGLRVDEVSRLRGEQIDLERGILSRVEGKGGKLRDVPIRDKDRAYFGDLKERTGEGRCCPVATDSLNKSIRDELKRVGLDDKYKNTTEHAVRKFYARERMAEITGTTERDNPKENKAERQAWETVQAELGHGNNLRMALYTTYIG